MNFAGVTFRPGEYLYSDDDGIVIAAAYFAYRAFHDEQAQRDDDNEQVATDTDGGATDALDELAAYSHPQKHRNVTKLAGRKGGMDFRLRVGSYRVKLSFMRPHDVLVTRIEHRQAGY